ncbi:hypothetical protein [uncultured Ruminococcus sp.]|uniref:hypothetical protein n=1 Tax=uncultured Ruminococcus sp. TaxID=165186 RepID=UPI0025937CB9|nr:hypothetical protein [uncultured Ruminococcus sp.]
MNYDAQPTASNGIRLDWHTDIPEWIHVAEPDLCSLLENLIENAFAGCSTVEDTTQCYQ